MLTRSRKRKLDAAQNEPEPVDHLSTLNVHCLLEILDYLDFKDILIMCRTSKHFLNVIKTRVISRREFVLRSVAGIYSTSKAFEYFGDNIVELSLHFRSNVENERIFSLMARYCSHERLKKLHINFTAEYLTIQPYLIMSLSHFFNNLECLKISSGNDALYVGNIYWINDILGCTKNLQKLSFDNIELPYDLIIKVAGKLTELSFCQCLMFSVQKLNECFRRNPSLNKLIFNKVWFIEPEWGDIPLIDVITERLPNLEYLDFRAQDIDLTINSSLFDSILKCSTLKIYFDFRCCMDPCSVLAKVAIINNIQKLMIESFCHDGVEVDPGHNRLRLLEKTVPNFTSLHTICLVLENYFDSPDYDFYAALFKYLPNIKKCILHENMHFCSMSMLDSIVEFSNYLTVLEFKSLCRDANMTKSWYKRSLKIKLDRNDNFCLKVFTEKKIVMKLKRELRASYQENVIKLSVLAERSGDPF